MPTSATAEAPASAPPKFREYEHHPLLKLFPTGSEEDLSAMAQSVAEKGVQQRIRIWKDQKGKWWLIDGTVRQEGSRRAFQAAVEADPPRPPLAANGLPLQPEVEEFFGTPDDVYQFIKTTHVRKHYSPGQKAAVGVQLYYFEYKKTHHGKLPTPQQEVEGENALTARELALLYGVNEYYIRICRQLYREAPDLFTSVAMGVIPPPKAKAELTARQKGNSPDAPGEGEDGEDVQPAAAGAGEDAGEADEQLEDAEGTQVPDNQKETFKAKAVFKLLRRDLGKAKEKVATLTSMDAGAFIDVQAIEKQFDALMKHMHSAEPHVVCPACEGRKHQKGQRYECKVCTGTGFLSRAFHAQYKKAQKAAEGGESEREAG